MSEFTVDEIEGIVKALSQAPPSPEEKIPLLPPGSYGPPTKVAFTPIEGERPRPLSSLTEKELSSLGLLKAKIEVVFGQAKLTLKEVAALEEGSLLPLNELCDDLVDIYANDERFARGEIVAVDGHFGVKIVSFLQKA